MNIERIKENKTMEDYNYLNIDEVLYLQMIIQQDLHNEKIKEDRDNRGRQTGFVDLTDTGKMFRSLDYRKRGFKNTLLFTNNERAKIAARHDFFGVGKKKVKRPFFSIGRTEEPKIVNEFSKFYFRQLGL